MVESGPISTQAEPPLGIFQARIEEKGRLKLPAALFEYLKKVGVQNVFITTVDMKLCRVYAKDAWQRNREFLQKGGDNTKDAQDIAFIADLYGAESDIDAHGRILVPQELRKKLELEGQQVWLQHYKDHINVFGKKIHEERMQRALVGLEDKVTALEKEGFK